MRIPPILLTLALLGMQAPAIAESATSGAGAVNPYAAHYYPRMQPPAARQVTPAVYIGRERVADYQRMLEDGYDLIGYSAFEDGAVSPELLAGQAAQLGADQVLVYINRAGSRASEEARYSYFASYWLKLQPPLLGVHVQREAAAEEGTGGLEVLAVIKDSPAAKAGLQQGDVLMGLADTRLRDPEQLGQVALGYAGQTVEASFVRYGVRLRTPVTLGRPVPERTP